MNLPVIRNSIRFSVLLAAVSQLAVARVVFAETSLADQLTERRAASAKRIDAETRQVMTDALDVIRKAGVEKRAVQVGQILPDFQLSDASGGTIDMAELRRSGPVVIVFYRGAWCPYCNLTLQAYMKHLDAFAKAGASLVAISPEAPDAALSLKEKRGLKFPVLTDRDNEYAREIGIVYALPPELARLYEKFGIPLLEKEEAPGQFELPLSATYVVNPDGEVKYAFIDVDYTRRAEPSEVLGVVESLK